MKFDLHCHSTASDGKLTPLALYQSACEAEIELLAVTDHDTVAGFQLLCELGMHKRDQPRLISGVELSCQWSGVGIHIIGLDFDADHEAITGIIRYQRQVRESRAKLIDKRLAAKLMPGTLVGALQYCPDIGQVGRPHFARFMVDKGYVSSEQQAFDRWLGNGKIGDVKSDWPEVDKAVAAITEAGGIAVVAHPLRYKMTFSKLKRLLADFSDCGGQAVEVVGHQVSPDKLKQLVRAVDQLGLAASGGSDFHDPQWRWAQLGRLPALPESLVPVWKLFNSKVG